MSLEKKDEMDEKFGHLSISELLAVLSLKSTPKKLKEQITMFICENYEHTIEFQFLQEVKKIEKMELTEFHRNYLINVKICARDIIQELELEHIDSLSNIKVIVTQKINAAAALR